MNTEDQAVWVEQAVDRIPRLIAQLPELEREVMVRHYFDGRTLPEIGAELGLEGDTLAAGLQRALTTLRDELRKP